MAAIAFCSAVSVSSAATRTWDGGGGDYDWTNPVNWDGDIVAPEPHDDVEILAPIPGGEITGVPSIELASLTLPILDEDDEVLTLFGSGSPSVVEVAQASNLRSTAFQGVRIESAAQITVTNDADGVPSASFNGGGLVIATGGSLVLDTSILVLSGGAVLTVDGDITSSSATSRAIHGTGGSYTQTSGTVSVPITTQTNVQATIGTGSTSTTFTRPLNFAGDVTADNVSFGDGVSFTGNTPQVENSTFTAGTTITVGGSANATFLEHDFAANVTVAASGTGTFASGSSFGGTFRVTGGSAVVGDGVVFDGATEFTGGAATIGAGATFTTLSTSGGAPTVTVGSGATFDGALTLAAGAMTVAGPAEFGGDVNLSGAATADIIGATVADRGAFTGAVGLGGTSKLTVGFGDVRGSIDVGAAASLETQGEITLRGASTVDGSLVGGTDGSFENRGGLVLGDGASVEAGSSTGSVTNAAGATLVADPGSTHSATITTNATTAFTNHGAIRVASGTLDVAGDFVQSATGTLTTQLVTDGIAAGGDFAQVDISGLATLGGTLAHERATSFPAAPTLSRPYAVLAYGSHSGAFTSTPGSSVDGENYLYADAPGASSLALIARKATTALDAPTVQVTKSVTVSGSGFVPNEIVTIDLGWSGGNMGGPVAGTAKDVVADGAGVIAATPITVPAGTLPTDANRAYVVNARGARSATNVRRAVTLTPPPVVDTDGDGLIDTLDCAPTDAKKPLQKPGVVDANCNGVDDRFDPKVLKGTKKHDTIIGALGNDRLIGGFGNDKLFGRAGNDLLEGGAGNDKLDGAAGNDRLLGGPGNDALAGGPGNDVVSGGPGNDRLTGGPGADKLNGGAGNDVIVARDGTADIVSCGPGRDFVVADRKDKVGRDCERVLRR